MQYSISVHPPRYDDVVLVVLTRWRGEGPTSRKNLQTDCGDPDLRDSRLWAHNLSARMGLEVRGAMMNTPQQKDIPNVFFDEEAALMMKLPKRHATPWKGGRLAPITIVISRG
jgi:hypothetical protein